MKGSFSGSHFRIIFILLPILLQFCFTCFCWLPNFQFSFSLFDDFGIHLRSIWHVFWSAWEPWQWSQNSDGSTILTLWTSFFQASFLSLNLPPTFARLLALLGISGFHLGGLLGSFGSKMEVQQKRSEKGRQKGAARNPGEFVMGIACP